MTNSGVSMFGWFKEPACTTRWSFAGDTVSGAMTLYAKWEEAVTSVSGIGTYIASHNVGGAGDSADNPIRLPLSIDLGTMTAGGSGWQQLLAAIDTAGKFVTLDLTPCTMTGTEFDPYYSVSTGKDKIVSIILPDAARKIPHSLLIFQHFSNLKSVAGVTITEIGDYAFSRCTSLTSASFPAAASIDYGAFFACSSLASVSFRASASIGVNSFAGCNNLTFTLTGNGALSTIEGGKALVRNNTELLAYPGATGSVTMSAITSIGHYAFHGARMTSASFPNVTSIGDWAFAYTGTGALSITLGATAPTLERDMFYGVDASKTVTVNVPSAASTNYGPAWQSAFKGKGTDNTGTENTNVTVNITTR
jgi:hypothetical protein